MNHGVFVPPFAGLSDPHRLIDLAHATEEAGWDGLFLWDHLLRPESNEILDTWVSLAAIAASTERIRLGPMVTPISRRRILKLAREILSVDLLSQGRLIMGFGLGVDTYGELTRLGETVDPRTRGQMLDDGARILADLFAGETVAEVGEHYTVDGVMLEPRPHQQPRPPFWFAARGGARKPVRRAARYDGLFPIDMTRDEFAAALDEVVALRGDLDGFDVCLRADEGGEPPPYADLGGTWLLRAWPAVPDMDELFDTVLAGPPD